MKVQVLPDSIVNKIAAGEVVERPASVVRELVDNSLDAGADDISVHLENGGHSLIRVSDNGSGMSKEDALRALERHATSKLRSEEDLDRIATFGFRGEALPAIAAVSKLRLRSRDQDGELATEILVEGGVVSSIAEIPGPCGSEVSVHHLFYNTPARRKFLKSTRAEEMRIKSWLQQSSIANPSARYRLFFDGREVLNLPPRASSVERAASFFKGATLSFQKRFPLRVEQDRESEELAIEVEGLIGHPSIAQADSQAFIVLVNNRLISDRAVVRAVKDGFDSTLKEREFPLGFVHLRLPSSLVDVNVHPQKSEVRFWDQRILFGLIRDLVFQTVRKFKAPAQAPSFAPQPRYETRPAAVSREAVITPGVAGGLFDTHQENALPREPDEALRLSSLRYIGQLLECYLLCESPGGLIAIDMHAAHERLNFNRIRNSVLSGPLESQRLLIPEEVELGEERLANLLHRGEVLSRFGFEVRAFDDQSVRIDAAPAMLDAAGAVSVIKELAAADFSEAGEGRIKEQVDSIAARIACHASVRAGTLLSREEAYALFEALDCADFGSACPHGRPVVAAFSKADVERWFGRDR